jgi:hypothetical protein
VTCRTRESPRTALATFGAAATVKRVFVLLPWWLAKIFAVPTATDVAKPESLTVATASLSDEYLESSVVTFEVCPSTYVTVRTNCCVAPTTTVGFAGVSLTPVMNRLLTAEPKQPDKARIDSKGIV